MGAQGAAFIIIGTVVVATSIYFYRLICARKQLTGKERLALFFTAALTGVCGGLSAIIFGIYPLDSRGEYWWLGIAFAVAGTVSFHVGLLLALIAYLQTRR